MHAALPPALAPMKPRGTLPVTEDPPALPAGTGGGLADGGLSEGREHLYESRFERCRVLSQSCFDKFVLPNVVSLSFCESVCDLPHILLLLSALAAGRGVVGVLFHS